MVPYPNISEWRRLDSVAPRDCDEQWAAEVIMWALESGYKYVNRAANTITSGKISARIPRGFLSDGSSGPAADRCAAAWWLHDRLYLSPYAMTKGRRVRVTRRKADKAYARLLFRSWHPLDALVSYLGLRAGGRHAWKAYREQEEEVGNLLACHCLPHGYLWDLPSDRLTDAKLLTVAKLT